MKPSTTVLAALAIVGGCASLQYTHTFDLSTRSYISAQDSGGLTHLAVVDAAREVNHVFETHGFALADSHVDAPNGELLLRFTKTYPTVVPVGDSAMTTYPGSVFYVWVTPVSGASSAPSSTIAIIGKPTFDGVEPCTSDRIGQPCQVITGQTASATNDSGAREADVEHGVMSELSLSGVIVGPLPTIPPVLASHRDPSPPPPPSGDPVGQI